MSTITKPIIYVDASSLKDSACQRRFLYTIYYGFNKLGDNRHLNYKAGYGSAVHKALEYWYSGNKNSAECIQAALEYYAPFDPYISTDAREYRTPSHLAQTLERYFQIYTPETDSIIPIKSPGTTLLETKFAIPYYSCDKFDVMLVGTIDMLAIMFGETVFVDHKSTGAYNIEEYFSSYTLSVQMMFYTWVLEKYLIKQRLPCVINGIFLKKPTVKGKVFDGVKLERSAKITFSDGQIQAFERWVKQQLKSLIEWFSFIDSQVDKFPSTYTQPNFSQCVGGKFGHCPYFSVCSCDPKDQDNILSIMPRVKYEPLRFSE